MCAPLLGLEPAFPEPERESRSTAGVGGAAAVGKAEESATGWPQEGQNSWLDSRGLEQVVQVLIRYA